MDRNLKNLKLNLLPFKKKGAKVKKFVVQLNRLNL